MLIYWLMILWVSCWGIISTGYSKKVCIEEGIYEDRTPMIFAVLMFSLITIFIGLRSGIADTGTYITMFNSYPTDYSEAIKVIFDGSKEPGFRLFSILIKSYISTDYHVWLMIICLISSIAIMVPLRKYSCNLFLSMFIFMASCQFTWLLNGMRQYLVVAILFACTELIIKNKTKTYLLIVILLSTIHVSSLIMIPCYFIVQGEPFNKKTMMLVMLVVIGIIFADKFTNIFYEVIETTDYANGFESLSESDDGTNIIRILIESVPIIIAFIYREKIKLKSVPKIISLSINMSLVSSCLYIVSKILKSGVMLGRLPIYFSIYNLILLPWLIKNLFEEKLRALIYYLCIVFYLIFFYFQMEIAWDGLGYISYILKIKLL